MISESPTSPRPAFLGAMLPHLIFPYQQQQHRKHPQEEQQLSPTPALQFLHDAAPYALPLEAACGRTTKTRVAHDDSWEARAFEEDVAKYSSLWPPRSYSCKYCSKDFRSAQALGGHMNIHRRERAFENRSNAFSSASLRPLANLAPTIQASGEGSNYLAAFDGCWIYLPDPTAQQLQVLHPSSASECSDYEQKTNPFACSLAFGLSAPISKSTTPSSVVTKGSLSFITSMNLTSMHEMGTPSNTINSDTLSDSSPQLSDQQSSQVGRLEARVGMQGRYLKNSKDLQQQTVPIENDLPVLDLELRLGMGGL